LAAAMHNRLPLILISIGFGPLGKGFRVSDLGLQAAWGQ